MAKTVLQEPRFPGPDLRPGRIRLTENVSETVIGLQVMGAVGPEAGNHRVAFYILVHQHDLALGEKAQRQEKKAGGDFFHAIQIRKPRCSLCSAPSASFLFCNRWYKTA